MTPNTKPWEKAGKPVSHVAPPVQKDSLGKVIWHAFTLAPVSSAIAFAMIFFAAGSVMAMTISASPEIAMGDFGPTPVHIARIPEAQAEVLGDSTNQPAIDDAALEGGDPSASLAFKPLSVGQNGRFNVAISYSVSNVNGSGVLAIGKYVVAQNIATSGTTQTGPILKPNMVYHVTFWANDSNGARQKLASMELRTPQARPCKTTGATPCLQIQDGKLKCDSASGNCPPVMPPCNEKTPCTGTGLSKCPAGSNCTKPIPTPNPIPSIMPPGRMNSGSNSQQ